MQHLVEAATGDACAAVHASQSLDEASLSFDFTAAPSSHAVGYRDGGAAVAGGRLRFPAFAAGAARRPRALTRTFLRGTEGHKNPELQKPTPPSFKSRCAPKL